MSTTHSGTAAPTAALQLAHISALKARTNLRQALSDADPVQALILLKLIEKAASMEADIAELCSAIAAATGAQGGAR